MLKNRVSLSIMLGFLAVLMAFYCGLAFSQSPGGALPPGGHHSPQQVRSALGVRVQVVASCQFMTSPTMDAEGLRRWALAMSDGASVARCGASRPLVVSGSAGQAGGGEISPGTRASLATRSGGWEASSAGVPYLAQVLDERLLISF